MNKMQRVSGVVFAAAIGLGVPAVAHGETVVGVGGNQERAEHAQGQHTMVDRMLSRDKSQGDSTVTVDYESSIWPDGPNTHDQSIADGKRELNRVLDHVPAGEHVVVKAHSLGSPVAQSVAPRVDKVITFGDPQSAHGIYSILGSNPWVGVTNPGPSRPAPNQVRVCHQFDGICDTRSPGDDPAYFAQSVAGYLTGRHTSYQPDEGENLSPGEHLVPEPAPIQGVPASTQIKPVQTVAVVHPYVPTPIKAYVPAQVQKFIPKQVLGFVPPPIPGIN